MAAATAEQLRVIATAYQAALGRIAARNAADVEALWRSIEDIGDVSLRVRLGSQTETARRTATGLTRAFFDSYLRGAWDEAVPASPVADVTVDTGQYRPVLTSARNLVAGGADTAAALAETAPQAGAVADADVTLAARDQTITSAEHHGIGRFVRRPEPTACNFCQEAAKQVYIRSDLRPLHGHCHCIVVPMVGATPVPAG